MNNSHTNISVVLLLISLIALFLFGCTSWRSASKSYLEETKQQRDGRMKWWRDARFGMFIHWGVYAVPAGTYKGKHIGGLGEWIMANADIPRGEYEKFAPQFNPTQFDAAQWVQTAKDAGMKYIVITSKHHDGFCMFDSKVTDYDIVDATPYGRDVMKALSQECKKASVKFCFYYSILDWHHPAQQLNPDPKKKRTKYSKNLIKKGSKDEYIDYMKAQLKELIKNYDPAVLWFDGEWVDWWTAEDGCKLVSYLRSLKPNLVINNRVGKRRAADGDFGTPEQEIPATGLDYDWETCMTINKTWGFKADDHEWKSTETLVHNLIDIASKGGNFLLNVGPTAEGSIPQPSIKHLQEMGQWLRANGQAIYGTSASPFERPKWGRFTCKGRKLYAHVFDWPKDRFLKMPAADNKLSKAYLLTDRMRKSLKAEQSPEGITVSLPVEAHDKIATVVVLKFEDKWVK